MAELNQVLTDFYKSPEPNPDFASLLEKKLAARHNELLQFPQKVSLRQEKKVFWLNYPRSRSSALWMSIVGALVLLLAGAYTLARLKGYLPGFGFVSDAGKTYVLSQPVEVSRNGITIRVEKAVSEPTLFWVELAITGSLEEQDFSRAYTLLTNGEKTISTMGYQNRSADGDEQRTYSFPALQNGSVQVTLIIENLGGEDFSLPLVLRPLTRDELVPAQPENATPLQSKVSDGAFLSIDQIAYATDKTILQASLHFGAPNIWVMGQWQLQLTGSDGSIYPMVDITPTASYPADNSVRIYETNPFKGAEQLTFTLKMFTRQAEEDLPLMRDFSADGIGFSFDPGTGLQAGKSWSFDQTFKLADMSLHLIEARLDSPTTITFEFVPDGKVTGVMLYSPDPNLTAGAVGPQLPNGNLTASLTFKTIPSQSLEIRLANIYYTARGPFQISWQPQAAPIGLREPTATMEPTLTPRLTETPVSSNSIVTETRNLIQKFNEPLHHGPGWIHIQSETTTRQAPGQTFPPAFFRNDQWLEIDSAGNVTRSVWLDQDAEGRILQQSATIGNYTVNFTSGQAGFNGNSPYQFNLDEMGQGFGQPGTEVFRQDEPCEDGRRCIEIIGQQTFSQPVTNPGEAQSFWGAGQQVWIDAETGQTIEVQSFWLLEDGSKLINYTKKYQVVEKVESPPQEILNVLKNVVVP
jgi:hypothetical protein